MSTSLHNIHSKAKGDLAECEVGRGSVYCAGCGTPFTPDKNRRKFCRHACYADARSAEASVVDRFWAKVNKTDTCWLWTGATRTGYGFIATRRIAGRQVRTMAHRMSWELAYGAIPAGLLVLHKCDVHPCVNPKHLFLGTQQVNILDALAKGRLVGRNGQVLQARLQSTPTKGEQAQSAFGCSDGAVKVSRVSHGRDGRAPQPSSVRGISRQLAGEPRSAR